MIDLHAPETVEMVGQIVLDAIKRDHGANVEVTRIYAAGNGRRGGRIADIAGLRHAYRSDGVLIDVYRQMPSRMGTKRKNVPLAELRVQPAAISFAPSTPQAFIGAMNASSRSIYTDVAQYGAETYHITDDTGVPIGQVMKVNFPAEEAGNKPRQQWLALNAAGEIWFSFGRTREEAARWLLSDDAGYSKLQTQPGVAV